MIEYPKIETLYERDLKTGRIILDRIRFPEFENIKNWDAYEKIDGTNIRIALLADGTIKISGRTDKAKIHKSLLEFLEMTFTPEKLKSVFWKPENVRDSFEVQLFGEGYGPKIQTGGLYRKDVSIRLFDILIGRWWLKKEDVEKIAFELGVKTVPKVATFTILPKSADDLKKIILQSVVALEDNGLLGAQAEGIVAHEPNGMMMRTGRRVMWKLKFRDFSL